MSGASSHSAGGQLAGYLWQVRRALLELMRADTGTAVQIETRDDIVICSISGTTYACLQAKHSLDAGSLSPSSVEIWKSLRAWVDNGEPDGSGNAERIGLVATNSVDPNGLLAPFLGVSSASPSRIEIDELRKELDAISLNAPNKKLRLAYDAWKGLTYPRRTALLEKFRIEDGQAPLAAIDTELDKCSVIHVRPEHLRKFTEQLIGWFERRVDESLGTHGATISVEDLRQQVFEMVDALPTNLTFTASAHSKHPDPDAELQRRLRYLRQLELLDANEAVRVAAVHSRFRAVTERDIHLQRAVCGQDDLSVFDEDLRDFWLPVFSAPHETSQILKGWAVFEKCMAYSTSVAGASAPRFLVHGSFHELAHRRDGIGWHPDYLTQLKEENEE
jgi:hypothetical protein